MALVTMVMGESGAGKSASLRNFKKNEVIILNVADKALPFRGDLNRVNLRKLSYTERYDTIKRTVTKNMDKYKVFVIDDSQFLMSFELFSRAKEIGYGKFTDLAVAFKNLLDFLMADVPDDVTVYMFHHTEVSDTGKVKAKTIGKMLDNQLTVEGLFTIVIKAIAYEGNYKFVTNSDGTDTVKTPMDMFSETEIDNDLKEVDKVIRAYYGMPDIYKDKPVKKEGK